MASSIRLRARPRPALESRRETSSGFACGRILIDETLAIAAQVVDALGQRTNRIIHRDSAREHRLRADAVKVLDFGLARRWRPLIRRAR